VTDLMKIKAKTKNRGSLCTFVGTDVYYFHRTETNRIITSRDVRWLNKTWGEYNGTQKKRITEIEVQERTESETGQPEMNNAESDEDESDNVVSPDSDESSEEEDEIEFEKVTKTNPNRPSLQGEMKRLHTSYNPTLGADYAETAFVGATTSDFTEPKDFEEAWNHQDVHEREFWRSAI